MPWCWHARSCSFDRIAIFLVGQPNYKTMHGTWGTNEAGELIDERHFISPIPEHPTVQEALRRKDYVLVLEDTPLYYEKQEVGRGLECHGVALGRHYPEVGWESPPTTCSGVARSRRIRARIFKQYAAVLSQLLIRQRTQEALERFNRELEQRVNERTMQTGGDQPGTGGGQQAPVAVVAGGPARPSPRPPLGAHMQREWEWARRHQNLLAVLMIDVDEFKSYNDHFGHAKGDQCLQQVAGCCRRRSGGAPTGGPHGGEEFVILLCGPQPGGGGAIGGTDSPGLSELKTPHRPPELLISLRLA